MNKIILLALFVLANMISSIGLILLKTGSKGLKQFLDLFHWRIILGGIIFLIGTIIYIFLLKEENLSYLYPLTSISYVFVMIFSAAFIGEKMNKFKWMGISLIIMGSILISL